MAEPPLLPKPTTQQQPAKVILIPHATQQPTQQVYLLQPNTGQQQVGNLVVSMSLWCTDLSRIIHKA
ncbi:hypothetical protein NECAME_13379 [Necator americanus]|uniref:Uncharacterized protein n=1 Tax=Necator americanus TaxID=51031 RepID=W2SW73_NECAM|nr:hypothetical protein NECAME_13379 [Necator americanus]ETN73870.1 hypothetical protein NECAME_13379 [Necator americanus]